MEKKEIVKFFDVFNNPESDGPERFLSEKGRDEVFERLKNENDLHLNKVQLNQLFLISGLTSITFDFFKYYWLSLPKNHPYNIEKLEGHEDDFDEKFFIITDKNGNSVLDENGKPQNNVEIKNLKHLRWGLRRIYVDSLLYFGNITLSFNELNKKDESELINFFNKKRFQTEIIRERGHAMEFNEIDEEERYLISEMVCKSLDVKSESENVLKKKLLERYKEANSFGVTKVRVGVLLDKNANLKKYKDVPDAKIALKEKNLDLTQDDEITTSDIINEVITCLEDIDKILGPLQKRFVKVRKQAIGNTRLYLSLVNDMDVYVATSMRNKDDFLNMGRNCKEIFKNPDIKGFNLRYFDPTISASDGHEDKGIIECLMVQCAKVLIYSSGDKDSYGKDVETAMALSSGKPVIFYCPDEIRRNLSKDIHPLTKMIDFKTGVANGAMVAKNIQEVIELVKRLFNNDMQYKLEKKVGYFRLKEILTDSTIRIQTSDLFLSKSFWNYFTRHVKE